MLRESLIEEIDAVEPVGPEGVADEQVAHLEELVVRADRDDVPPLDQRERIVDLDDVLIELVAPREVLGAGDHGRRPREDDGDCRKRLLIERVVAIVADARVGEPELVHRFAERGIELPDRRVGLALESVERVGKPPRREAREADVVQRADVVVPDRQLVVAARLKSPRTKCLSLSVALPNSASGSGPGIVAVCGS